MKEQYHRCMSVNATRLLKQVQEFKEDSEKGIYYEATTSKNAVTAHGEVAKTITWQKNLAQLLGLTSKLSRQGQHSIAAQCYIILFDCIDLIYSVEEENILFVQNEDDFAEGLYTLQQKQIDPLIKSLAKTASPADYARLLIPFIVADYPSCEDGIYRKAMAAANPAQKTFLEKQIIEKEIKVSMEGDYGNDYDY